MIELFPSAKEKKCFVRSSLIPLILCLSCAIDCLCCSNRHRLGCEGGGWYLVKRCSVVKLNCLSVLIVKPCS